MDEFLYHITDRRNLSAIKTARRLLSASTAISASALSVDDKAKALRTVRDASTPLPGPASSQEVWLNDQVPLRPFRDNPGIDSYVALLNEHVFFWRCSPIDSYSRNRIKKDRAVRAAVNFGFRFDPRSAGSSHVLIRLKFESVVALNADRGPFFSSKNTGSPDRRIAGARTDLCQLTAGLFTWSSADAVEVVFRGWVDLPQDAARWEPVQARWIQLS